MAYLKRAFLLLGTLVLLVLAFGLAAQAILSRNDAARFPMPGRLVDIGGYKLHLHCTGQGSPTVILDTGLGSPATSWVLVQREISKLTRVCNYDRAGYGFSDFGPLPRTSEKIADELHSLLGNASEMGPYILVGHSFGGLNVRNFEHKYPSNVAGLILVDAASEESLNSTLWMSVWQPYKKASSVTREFARLVARLGIGRLFSPDIFSDTSFSSEEQSAINSSLFSTKLMLTTIDEFQAFVQSLDEAKKSCGPIGNKPLMVIEAGKRKNTDFFPFLKTEEEAQTMKQEWNSYQRNLAKLSLRSTHLIAKDSAHRIPYEQPDIIIDAIKEMITLIDEP